MAVSKLPALVLYLAATFTALVTLSTTHESGLRWFEQQRNLREQSTKWPSLSLNFTIKREPMQVYGQSAFVMLANPVVSDDVKVLYDAFATFSDDAAHYNYTLMNGISYISRTSVNQSIVSTRCLDSDVLPPINSIAAAINEAVEISSTPTECSEGKLFQVSVGGTSFALCYSGSADFTLHGNDMDIDVEFLTNRVNILEPTVDANTAHQCRQVAVSNSVTPTGAVILKGEPNGSGVTRKLKAEIGFSSLFGWDDSDSSNGSAKMPEAQDEFPEYWGNLTGHTPCCSSVKYSHLDTVNNTWYSAAQQEKVCARAAEVSETSTASTISDTIIITHSMGGLMMAGAIANERCSLAESTTWVSLGSPMGGSMGSDFTQDSCDEDASVLMEIVGDITGRCPATVALKSLAYENGNYSFPALNKAYKAAQEVYRTSISGAICSNGYSGLVSSYQWQFWLMGSLIPHESDENDGMVEFQSCRAGIPEAKFGDHYRDPFYVSKLNHYDLEFLSGDSLLDTAKMPLKWFECLL
ncbi:hypothetical protein PHYBOEH_001662 [Phytophthora boehmeriae]|uniref:GPI inositol-deacylase n=1 Tax=Phytophthora boehmeriae TaxID=109152 RepID=A0A8T1V5N1_9STRA|nr:hypothetical protein PHYBOEH_001662 [Phytophthora boehmeriae]